MASSAGCNSIYYATESVAMKQHIMQWEYLNQAAMKQQLAHAYFFVGALHEALDQFTVQFAQFLLCRSQDQKPCLQCSDCLMAHSKEHPDLAWIKPEKKGSAIKIDQIRELHRIACLTPQRSLRRVIVIECADKMNTAAANALLKILEEPSSNTHFILIAEQLGSVLATVLSRCQVVRFNTHHNSIQENLLVLGSNYAKDSARAQVSTQAESILDALITVLEKKQHPCVVAALWMEFDLEALLWFLYLAYAQVQYMHVRQDGVQGIAVVQLERLKILLDPISIFAQLDKISTILKNLSHQRTINQLLTLEDLLFEARR